VIWRTPRINPSTPLRTSFAGMTKPILPKPAISGKGKSEFVNPNKKIRDRLENWLIGELLNLEFFEIATHSTPSTLLGTSSLRAGLLAMTLSTLANSFAVLRMTLQMIKDQ